MKLYSILILSFAAVALQAMGFVPNFSFKAQEAQYANMIEGAQKELRLASEDHVPYCVVNVHGYSATRMEIAPVPERVSEGLKAHIFFTRLKGHGLRSEEALTDATMEDWDQEISDALEICRKLSQSVIVIATSTGAPLVIHHMKEHPEQIAALILVSPNFRLAHWSSEIIRWDWGLWLAEFLYGKFYEWKPKNDLQAKFWTHKYRVLAARQVVRVTDRFQAEGLSFLKAPVLALINPSDQVVSGSEALTQMESLQAGNSKIVKVTDAQDSHLIIGDIMSPNKTDWAVTEILNFIKDPPKGKL